MKGLMGQGTDFWIPPDSTCFIKSCILPSGVGVALFGRKSSHKVATKLQSANVPLGYGLCLLNLAFDGYTNAAQDEIIKKHPKSPPIHMMCW